MTAEEADQEEFERWYLASRNALIAAAFLYVGKMEDALDLTQETYARAWQHWDVVSRHANRDAWNRLVLHNLAVSRWRRLAVESPLRLRQVPQQMFDGRLPELLQCSC